MKLEKYLNEEDRLIKSFNIEYSVTLKINTDTLEKAQNIAYKYCKTIKTKGKDKVTDIDFEYSEESN